MKYTVEGILAREQQKFTMEIEAKSEKHAKELACIRLGSVSKIPKSKIQFTKVSQKK